MSVFDLTWLAFCVGIHGAMPNRAGEHPAVTLLLDGLELRLLGIQP